MFEGEFCSVLLYCWGRAKVRLPEPTVLGFVNGVFFITATVVLQLTIVQNTQGRNCTAESYNRAK
jgi:hypothetical protein